MSQTAHRDIIRQLREEGLPPQERTLSFDRELIDVGARTVQVVVSTETPVSRFYGDEVLSHKRSAVMLDRFNDSSPVLVGHNTDDQVGVVEPGTARVSDSKLRATVRFGQSARAQEIFQDIQDGIRTKVSVGYRVHKLTLQESDDSNDTYRADLWEPHEVSVVPVPADVNAKVGRSDAATQPNKIEIITMSEQTTATDTTATETRKLTERDFDAELERARNEGKREANASHAEELKRRADIEELGREHNASPEDVRRFIDEKREPLEFAKHVLTKVRQDPANGPLSLTPSDHSTQQGLTKQEERDLAQFSINTIIQHALGVRSIEGVAKEMVQEGYKEAREAGITVKGTPVPQCAMVAKRSVSVGSGGTATVQTDVGGIIDFLRERLVLQRLGAQFLTGLSNNIDWPVMGRGTPPTHKAEIDASDEYDWTSAALPMRPHRLPVTTELSHQLVIQSTIDAERYTRETLGNEIAIVMQETALKGSGVGPIPEGILNVGGIGSIDLSGGAGGLNWANIISFESAIAAADADTNAMAYLTHPNYRGTLKATAKDAGSGQFIWNQMRTDNGLGQGEVNGYPAMVSTQLTGTGTAGEMIFGVWRALVMGQWGGLDLVVDNLSKAEQGLLRVIAWTFYDHVVERPEHFAASTNIGAA